MGRADRPPGGLWASYDQKVSPRQGFQEAYYDPRGRLRKARHVPNIGNSFGLPAGVTCPGRTGFCGSCYGASLERVNPGVAPALAHNLELLQSCGDRIGPMLSLIEDLLDRYRHEARRLSEPERIFRVHWDGDYFSANYARAWAVAMSEHPDVRFWCYTRSFRPPLDVIPILAGVPNLALYLSVDAQNRAWAAIALARWSELHAAYCAEDYTAARELGAARADRDLSRPVSCPENARRIPVASNGAGACVSCGICPAGRRDILFATSHRELAGAPLRVVTAGGRDLRRPDVYVCGWEDCRAEFTRPASTRGRKPTYCSRDCQVKAYLARRSAVG